MKKGNAWPAFPCCPMVLVWLVAGGGGLVRPALAQDWPQWRGPNRDGIAVGTVLPAPWPKSLRHVWKAEVGEGHSAPVVAGRRVVLFVRRGGNEVVLCLNAEDGRELWHYSYAAPYTPRSDARPHGKGPKATPTLAGDKAYALGVTGILTCVALRSGDLVWQKQFSDRFKKTYPLYGAANSPLVEGGLCILGIGGHDDGALVAFHKDTGKLVWELPGDGPSYASPIAVDLAGQRQVVTFMQTKLVGVEPRTGRLLWEALFRTSYDMNIITPVFHSGMILYSGYQKGTTAVRPAKGDGKWIAQPVWRTRQPVMFMSSPLIHGDHLYGLTSQAGGRLMCIRLSDGKKAWSSPGRMGEYVSIVRAGSRLLVLRTNGELLLVAADPSGYRELGRTRVASSPTWAHLALAGNRIYVKDRTGLACFELASP